MGVSCGRKCAELWACLWPNPPVREAHGAVVSAVCVVDGGGACGEPTERGSESSRAEGRKRKKKSRQAAGMHFSVW